MKRLIALIFLVPALASGTVDLGNMTSGSATFGLDTSGIPEMTWMGSGPGFSIASGASFCCEFAQFAPQPFPAGSTNVGVGPLIDTLDGTLALDSFKVGGVEVGPGPGDIGLEAEAAFGFSAAGPITHAGPYSGSFALSIEQITGCANSLCTAWSFQGTGSGVVNVVPAGPGHFIIDSASFTVPEPSTTALLLLGFAGLAVLCLRRRSCAIA